MYGFKPDNSFFIFVKEELILDIMEQIRADMKKVYLQDNKPICLLFSGGKDSSLLLTLLWDVLLTLPKELLTKTVHVMTSETGVETPLMEGYVDSVLDRIENAATKDSLPIIVHRVKPDRTNNLWYKLLGKGTLISTPKTKHRWCTFSLKIKPAGKKLKELISTAPVNLDGTGTVLTCWMGVRNEESARRKMSIEKFSLSEESLWSRHTDFKEIMCYSPLRFVSGDELWLELLNRETLPYGVTVDELSVQYGEGVLECGMKTSSSETGNACGAAGNRNGCWICGMVSGDDPMLLRYIQEGHNYSGMLEWKKLMLSMRNDIRYREIFPRT